MVKETRLVILACSQRKRTNPTVLPAIERYDGPTFRVLRRYLKTEAAELTDVRILSAEFGLLAADRSIPNYDRHMTPERACELRPSVAAVLSQILNERDYNELFVCVGQVYLQAMGEFDTVAPPTVTIHMATGSLGRRLSQLHDWLNNHPPLNRGMPQPVVRGGRVRIRGVEIRETRAHTLDIARQALAEGVAGVDSYQSWYVPVDNRTIAPKWLVSQLSGLPVSAFTTDEARRVLMQLGIGVERV